MKAVVRRSTL